MRLRLRGPLIAFFALLALTALWFAGAAAFGSGPSNPTPRIVLKGRYNGEVLHLRGSYKAREAPP